MAEADHQPAPPFEIFRARDAADYREDGPMYLCPMDEAQAGGMAALGEAGMLEGSTVRLVYKRPGMSLTYCWFKSGFPLPLHSHSADCLYFIVAGSLRIGTENLGPGDGFFLGADVPYAYVPGEGGVEVLEFRTADRFDFKALAKNPDYWGKALAGMMLARAAWPDETAPPSGLKIG